MLLRPLLVAALTATVLAQSNTSLCDRYTTALFVTNNAVNQYTFLTMLINTAFVGNYSALANQNAITGILAEGTVNGETVSLSKYFRGSLFSTNRGSKAVSVNFLDGGGASVLRQNKPANVTSSNQYYLFTHLYKYFGALLGCSQYGQAAFTLYNSETSMYTVHRFMALDSSEITYFIQQLKLAALSFGFTTEDASIVDEMLSKTFNSACQPPTALLPGVSASLNSICLDKSCSRANPADCGAYDTTNSNGTEADPVIAGSQSSSGGASGSSTAASSSSTGTSSKGDLSSGGSNKALEIGLGIGLGIGIPLLLAGVALVFFCLRRKRMMQRRSRTEIRTNSDDYHKPELEDSSIQPGPHLLSSDPAAIELHKDSRQPELEDPSSPVRPNRPEMEA